jgi:hypothetical protein
MPIHGGFSSALRRFRHIYQEICGRRLPSQTAFAAHAPLVHKEAPRRGSFMAILLTGVILFFGVHLFSYARAARARLIATLGEGPYKGVYSLVSAIGLGLMIWGYVLTRAGPNAADVLYWPPTWGRHVTMLLVFLGALSIAVYLHKGRLKLWLRNPMSIGVALWAGGHLFSNGEVASVILFGSFLLYALLDIVVNTIRSHVPSFTPKPRHDPISILAGLALYAFFLFVFHPYVLNVPVV